MAIDTSGLYFFMPIFSFLFVFVVVYAILAKTKILSGSNFIHALISFIMAIVFISFSSMELFVRTIIPWFVVLIVILFFVLLVAAFSTKAWDKIMTPEFAWAFIAILIIIFIIAAIKVFNPVLHASNNLISSGNGSGIINQIIDFFIGTRLGGGILLLIIAGVVAWIITKK
jgi:hypothetical protein